MGLISIRVYVECCRGESEDDGASSAHVGLEIDEF